ncbi:hypothetical protein ATJ97_1588 [Georgenia soli]|uniref:Fibronectin type-III domain-containing protein n=1 Tax=Georgenia soli TaxID=638953 RepID=A0A2A9EJV6_9MICO|nr:hypothetical protein [Georgenia soli]PFG39093.1 hypothetical protein ATJ97_1588 [Georgenia soli]
MNTARLISVTAAIAASVALFSPGGSSYAAWSDTVVLAGTISSGQLSVEPVGTSVEVVGGTVVVTASAHLAVQGDALTAKLDLDLAGFTLANGTTPPGMVVDVSETTGRLTASSGSWNVDRTYNGAVVTARIQLPVAEARAMTAQPRVIWRLQQSTPGQGWSAQAVHEVSFAGVPSIPTFPELGCLPGSSEGGSITIFWTWDGKEPLRWQILERNSAENNFKVVQSITADGRTVYTVTVPTQNDNWLYSVRAVYQDGTTKETQYVTRSCAVVK